MTDNIKSIFNQNIRLLKSLDNAIYYFRQQKYDKALGIVVDSIDPMKYVIDAIITDRDYFNLVTTDSVLEMLTGILNAQKKKDFILLTDLLELQMVNFLCGVQELIISKEEILFDEEKYFDNIKFLKEREDGFTGLTLEVINPGELLKSGYRVEFTSCGLMTLAAENNGAGYYFHSNSRVYSEAVQLAGSWYDEGVNKYILYGLGMGYQISSLHELAPEADIEVYESDLNVIKLACAFNDMKGVLDNDRVKLFYDPDFKRLTECALNISKAEAIRIHYPSFQNIRNKEGREIVERFVPWSKNIESC